MSYTLSFTRNEIIDSALRKFGVMSPTSAEYTDSAEQLNMILRNINVSERIPYTRGPDWYGYRSALANQTIVELVPDICDVIAVSAIDPMTQVLSEQSFTADWSHSGDFDDATGDMVYTHSAGSGTFTQAASEFTSTDFTNGKECLLSLSMKNSAAATSDVAFVLSGDLFQRNVSIPITDSTDYADTGVVVKVADITKNFVIAGTSSIAVTVTIETIGLYPINTTEYPLIRISMEEYADIAAKSSLSATDIPQYYAVDKSRDKTMLYLYPGIGSTHNYSCIKYIPLRQMKLPKLASGADVLDVSQSMYRFITWQLAADMAAEFGRSVDERQWLNAQAGEALSIVTGQKE